MKLNKCIKKICCFYASDWHLTVMLLPYINKNIDEKNKIYMKFEHSIEDKMKILLGKLKIKNEKSIRNIDWNEKIGEEEICENTKVYIISGSEEYIKEKNELIEQYYCNRDDRVKIINCYSVSEEKNLNNIIKNNNYKNILNTKGECRIKNNS